MRVSKLALHTGTGSELLASGCIGNSLLTKGPALKLAQVQPTH